VGGRVHHRLATTAQIGLVQTTSSVSSLTPPSLHSVTFPRLRAPFGAGIFHLMTHAFFKALLFSRQVRHSRMGGEQTCVNGRASARKSKSPTRDAHRHAPSQASRRYADFFSKDSILGAAFRFPAIRLPLGLLTALLTSFYMFRLIFLTFHGKQRYDESLHCTNRREHCSPLVTLAVLSSSAMMPRRPSGRHGSLRRISLAGIRRNARSRSALSEAAAHSLELTLAVCRRHRRHHRLFSPLSGSTSSARQARANANPSRRLPPRSTTSITDELYAGHRQAASALSTNVL